MPTPMLSRLPEDDPNTADPEENFVFKTVVDSLPITTKQIKDSSRKGPVLIKVCEYTRLGWPNYSTDCN